MEFLLVLGKFLYSVLFVSSGVGHIVSRNAMSGYAQYKRLPMPMTSVLVSGAVIIVAPVLFLFGIYETVALWAIVAFLLGTLVFFHRYWTETDATTKQNEQIAFNKNLALIGATLVIIALL